MESNQKSVLPVSISVIENRINLTSNSQYGTIHIKLNIEDPPMAEEVINIKLTYHQSQSRNKPKSQTRPWWVEAQRRSARGGPKTPKLPPGFHCRIPNSPLYALYKCREASTNRTFYAKQTQSPKPQNQCNSLYHKGLRRKRLQPHQKKQTQSNPNSSRRSPNRNRIPHRRESIEHRVSRIKHLTHLAAHSWLHCAKQTQFPQPQNPLNLLYLKELHQYSPPLRPKKQTQTNPTVSRHSLREVADAPKEGRIKDSSLSRDPADIPLSAEYYNSRNA